MHAHELAQLGILGRHDVFEGRRIGRPVTRHSAGADIRCLLQTDNSDERNRRRDRDATNRLQVASLCFGNVDRLRQHIVAVERRRYPTAQRMYAGNGRLTPHTATDLEELGQFRPQGRILAESPQQQFGFALG